MLLCCTAVPAGCMLLCCTAVTAGCMLACCKAEPAACSSQRLSKSERTWRRCATPPLLSTPSSPAPPTPSSARSLFLSFAVSLSRALSACLSNCSPLSLAYCQFGPTLLFNSQSLAQLFRIVSLLAVCLSDSTVAGLNTCAVSRCATRKDSPLGERADALLDQTII